MPTVADSATAKNGTGGGLFHFHRRAQSLRFPRTSTAAGHCPLPSASSTQGFQNVSRSGSRNYRSKSSKHRFGSIEGQSLLGRMSASQRIALIGTWRQMRHQHAQLCALMRKCLVELEQTEPIVKKIFYKAGYVDCWEKVSASGGSAVNPNPATLDEHVRLMAKFFDDLVAFVEGAGPTGIEGGEEITASIKTLGQQHAFLARTSSLSPDVWDKLGEIAVEKICAVECVQRTREAGRAWRTLIAFWTDKIRCGFEGEAKAFSRRPSTEVQSSACCPFDAGGTTNKQCEELGRRLQQLMTSDECGRQPSNGYGANGGSASLQPMGKS